MLEEFTYRPLVAYFSMEIALQNEIPTYAGGLGVLAGDTMRSSSDLALPIIGVTLVSLAGYFRQAIDEAGRQVEHPDWWRPEDHAVPLEARVAIPMEGREVWIRGWLYVLEGHMGGRTPIVLLDTDVGENREDDRQITHYLYGGDEVYRLKQEMVLGIGGARMLQALGVTVLQYHLNEGHSALLTLELLRRYAHPRAHLRTGEARYDVPRVRELCNFTTHTPVEAGHDQFSYDLVQRLLGTYFDLVTLKSLAGQERLNMTRLALNLSLYINGVAKRHTETSRVMFPGYEVRSVTNGVHPFAWTGPSFVQLYDTHFPGWCHEPDLLVRADRLSDAAVWSAHSAEKEGLLKMVKERSGVDLDPAVATLGFARRMTGYKRPDLLFSDLERLKHIAQQTPLQIVLAGKAHPRDEGGKGLIERLHRHVRELPSIRIAYLPNYDMTIARVLVAGVDVWLNTPLPPMEASGTSGMKASFNGVPNLSVLDGWWAEGYIEGVTGWAIGELGKAPEADAESLYQKLEQVVLPLYYSNRSGWIAVMKGAISRNASFFNSHRMMRRYTTEAYVQ